MLMMKYINMKMPPFYDYVNSIFEDVQMIAPTYFYDGSKVSASMITKGCEIHGIVENSVISSECVILDGAVVKNSILFPGTVVEKGAEVNYAILGENAKVGAGAHVGEPFSADKKGKITVLGSGYVLGCGETAKAGEMLGAR